MTSKFSEEQKELDVLEMIERISFRRDLATILVNLEDKIKDIDNVLSYILKELNSERPE